MPEDLDREKFYAPPTDDWGDDADEYEVEPPDAEVLAAEERRAAEEIAAACRSIDINEIYRDADSNVAGQILDDWARNIRWQFQIKHLLIATAILAILLTLWKLQILMTSLALLFMVGVGGVFLYLQWKERQHQEAADRRRRELYERRRAEWGLPGTAPSGQRPAGSVPPSNGGAVSTSPRPEPKPLRNEADIAWQEAMARERTRITFSLGQMLLAITCASIVLGLVSILGPTNAAMLLGTIAVCGLLVHALGYEPPGIVTLGWWVLLVLYVVVSVVATIWKGIQGG